MSRSSRARDFLSPGKSTDRPASNTNTAWRHSVSPMTNPDLYSIVALCTIAVLTLTYLIFRFPDLGALIERYNQF
jgi:hypothetical protein